MIKKRVGKGGLGLGKIWATISSVLTSYPQNKKTGAGVNPAHECILEIVQCGHVKDQRSSTLCQEFFNVRKKQNGNSGLTSGSDDDNLN